MNGFILKLPLVKNVLNRKSSSVLLGLCLLPGLVFVSCLGYFPCSSKDIERPLEILERYFHCFDEGNSWVYINQNNNTTDSLYLKHISGYIPQDCKSSFYRTSLIFPSCLFPDTIFCDYNSRGFFLTEKYPYKSFSFIAKTSIDTLRMTITDRSGIAGNCWIEKNITLPDGQNYSDVINCNDRFWIAPNMGIVQFVSYDGEDMFYLKKYYKK